MQHLLGVKRADATRANKIHESTSGTGFLPRNDVINFELDKIEDVNSKFITQSDQFYGTYFIFSKRYYEIFF